MSEKSPDPFCHSVTHDWSSKLEMLFRPSTRRKVVTAITSGTHRVFERFSFVFLGVDNGVDLPRC